LSFGQSNNDKTNKDEAFFTVRGSVYLKDTREPIDNVSIQINNGKYTRTDIFGKFVVKARVGDELTIMHDDFDTVHYTIISDERITILVEEPKNSRYISGQKNDVVRQFNQMIDSADAYLKKDAAKSIKFVGDALNYDVSSRQSAEAHELLGDIYVYWKQYDLAISAYKVSLQNLEMASSKLKLADAYTKNEEYQKSIDTYKSLNEKDLSNYEKTVLYEGLGDAYLKLKNTQQAISSYEKGLEIAKKHLIAPKVTDLNSKIAQAYNARGEVEKAKGFYSNSLKLAKKENKKRAVEEQIKVAEFNSSNMEYDSEIALRKDVLETLEDIEKDSVLPNESPLKTTR
jgi:tetratricopeptide (TPR) repeat protein